MFNWVLKSRQALLIASTSAICTIAITGCGSEGDTVVRPTPQGTIELNLCKVGMPESTFKDAIITFVPDPNGSVDGKVQYLSRGKTPAGGQYVAQCKNDQCYLLQQMYVPPVAREVALKAVHELLPAAVPPQSKDDDSQVNKKDHPVEIINFGDEYHAEINYADKSGTQVSAVGAWYQPKAATTASTN